MAQNTLGLLGTRVKSVHISSEQDNCAVIEGEECDVTTQEMNE